MLNILGVHAGVWLTGGGFYNLDSFFALSGFLITSLLIAEWRKRGKIRLATFWARRARRLLPGLFLMLFGLAFIFGLLVPAGTYPGLRGDALGSLFYYANWHFILGSSNYFNQTSLTSPLIHMWSLSLEEQFYVVWPLITVTVFAVWRSLRALLVVCVVGTLASALEMALLFKPGNTTRLYFGTDTHAQSVLVGAALAVGLAMWAERRGRREAVRESRSSDDRAPTTFDWEARSHGGRVILTLLGTAGLIGSAVLYTSVNPTEAFVYRGGFLLASLAACAVLLCVSCHQRSPVARILSFPLFTYVGRISYGTYLWHFPLFTYIDHSRTGLSGWALAGVRIAPTLAIASASFYLVERPIRTGTLFTSWRAWLLTPFSVVGVTAVVLVATTAPVASVAPHAPTTGSLPAPSIAAPAPSSYGNAPVRALLVGDSEALTLGFGLSTAAKASPQKYHVTVFDQGIVACGVADGSTFTKAGQAGQLVGWPCSADPSAGDCPPGGIFGPKGNVACQAWTDAWADWVKQIDPNVVVLLAGAAEVLDRVFDGHTTNILDPTFAAYVKSQLEKAVQIATAGGARMIFMTKPCQDTGEQPDGNPWPEDSPSRQLVYNTLLRQVAQDNPGKVSVQDLNRYVCPGGTYSADLHGVPIRGPDGVHFQFGQPGTGGDYLAPAILPYWEELGHLQEAGTDGASISHNALPTFFAPA
jgi:peptidoglycan/LPS O-acetylase OafA/YrhL